MVRTNVGAVPPTLGSLGHPVANASTCAEAAPVRSARQWRGGGRETYSLITISAARERTRVRCCCCFVPSRALLPSGLLLHSRRHRRCDRRQWLRSAASRCAICKARKRQARHQHNFGGDERPYTRQSSTTQRERVAEISIAARRRSHLSTAASSIPAVPPSSSASSSAVKSARSPASCSTSNIPARKA